MKPKTLQVYLGWDPREQKAYEVARNSIWKKTKEPIKIMPLKIGHLDFLTRPIEHRGAQMWDPISDAPMSTEFAVSRFAIPFIQDAGWAVFADCDILCWSNIKELFDLADPRYAVMVVKHLQESGNDYKMDGQSQTYYNRKNWSSVVLWNCEHIANKRLTIEMLNKLAGRDLHSFSWLNDYEIGELPQKWNWLIGVTEGAPERSGIWHYTLGGPWLKGWNPSPYDKSWEEQACL
jgi:lipopolysaccharide biosynthesis glycosyltransferase